MPPPVILASGSEIRRQLLDRAGLSFTVETARIDEESVIASLASEGVSPRDMADALAEVKAARIALRQPGALVIGADQALDLGGEMITKCETPEAAAALLARMSGRRHTLHSAAVVFENGAPVWRHVVSAHLTMHPLSDGFIRDYLARNWQDVRHSVGCYMIEAEGPRLISSISGSHFAILGLPLTELIAFLRTRGHLAT